MAMIGGPLVKHRVRSGVTGEVVSERGSAQRLDQGPPLSAVAAGPSLGLSPYQPVGLSGTPPVPSPAGLQLAGALGAPAIPQAFALPDMAPANLGPSINVPPPAPHKKFFTHDGTGTGNFIVGLIGDALAGAAGQAPTYAPMMAKRREAADEEDLWNKRYGLKRADELADRQTEANKVQYFSGNEDRVAYDPTTGTSRTLYDAPTPSQTYAATLGAAPGTPAYADAIKDYVLRSSGPTAYEGRDALQADRYRYMGQLQAPRLATSRRNTDVRTSASIANNMRSTATAQRGQSLTDARTRGSAAYQGRGVATGGAAAVAVGPGGHKIVVKGGRWVDAQTGQPVQ